MCVADTRGRLGKENSPYPQREHWLALLAAAQNIDTAAIAAACANPAQIAAAIDAARLAQITPLQNAYRRQHTESH